MINHVAGKLLTVNEDQLAVNCSRKISSFLSKPGSCQKYTFASALTLECTRKFLDLRPSDHSFPTLGLDVDDVEAQPVLLDDSVDSAITRPSNGPPRILSRASITHSDQEIDYELLEKIGRSLLDLFQKSVG